MRTLFLNEFTNGINYTDMINKAVGGSYGSLQRSWVVLDDFGATGVIAWFVYMDGSQHGYPDEWIWENKISTFGENILEHNIKCPPNETLKKHQCEYGFHPYRLAFQIDPNNVKDNSCCRFVGAYALKKILNSSLTKMQYVRVMKDFKLGSKGESGGYLDEKIDIYNKMSIYKTSVKELGFSSNVLSILINGESKVETVGELLELPLTNSNSDYVNEIRQKLYDFLKDQ